MSHAVLAVVRCMNSWTNSVTANTRLLGTFSNALFIQICVDAYGEPRIVPASFTAHNAFVVTELCEVDGMEC